mgnify:CR=1 FL=1
MVMSRNNLGADAVLINVIVISVDGICTLAGYHVSFPIHIIKLVVLSGNESGDNYVANTVFVDVIELYCRSGSLFGWLPSGRLHSR